MSTLLGAKKNNFDTLRLFFAVLVVYSHSFPLLRGSNRTEPLFAATRGILTFGEVSVWSFFILSGFLITQSWQRSPDLLRFLRRRVSRIYPAFILATLVCLFVVYPIATQHVGHVSLWAYLTSTLRLQMFPDANAFRTLPLPGSINGSLWSIPFEFWCYVGVAALGLTRLLPRKTFIAAVMLLAMLGHLAIDVYHLTPGGKFLGKIFGYPVFWATVLPFFLAGMLMQLWSSKLKLSGPYAAVAAVCLVASLFVPHLPIFTLPVFGSYLLMWLAHLPLLNPVNLGRWGDFSYGTYLYAFPIQQLLVFYYLPRLTPVGLFLAAAPLSLLCGVTSWHIVEKRFLPQKTIRRLEEKGEELYLPSHGNAG